MAQQQNSASEGTLKNSQPKGKRTTLRGITVIRRIVRNIDVTIECKYEHVEIPSEEFEREVYSALEDIIQDEYDVFRPIPRECTVTLLENVRKTGDDNDWIKMPISTATEEDYENLYVRGWKKADN